MLRVARCAVGVCVMSAAHCVLCVVLCGWLSIVCCVLRSGWRAACGVVCEALRVDVLLYLNCHIECYALRGVWCVLCAGCCVLRIVACRVSCVSRCAG